PDAVVEHGHLAKGETAHRKPGRRSGDIDREHADGAGRRLGGSTVALLTHCFLTYDLDRRRRLEDGKTEEIRAAGDHIGVEWRRRRLARVARRTRRWITCWLG